MKIFNFGMKNSLTLPSLANNYFNSLGDAKHEPICTCTDPFMRKRVKCAALNQSYKSENSQKLFVNISEELDVRVDLTTILEN